MDYTKTQLIYFKSTLFYNFHTVDAAPTNPSPFQASGILYFQFRGSQVANIASILAHRYLGLSAL